ncbi:MAG TPA: hypothetical protein VLX68_01445 [Chitinivibrionales bacterium]|nr:hypothetical protein [Chitinivibrionales bacterium]
MRNYPLDFVKGLLVEAMIVYHSINYFYGAHHFLLSYIDFVTSGFVFLSGFIIPALYLKKYDNNIDAIFNRLIVRGIKIAGLFLVINTAVHLLIATNYNGVHLGLVEFYRNIWYVLVPGDRRLSAFELLLPIAYTLVFSAILLKFVDKKIIPIIVAAIFVWCMIINDRIFNLFYLNFGLSGFVLGLLSNGFPFYKVFYRRKWLSIFPVGLYFLVIFLFKKDAMIVYFLGTVAVLGATYLWGTVVSPYSIVRKTIIIMGEYSLLGYLMQIFFLQILFRVWGNVFNGQNGILYSILITTVIVWGLCFTVNSTRRQSILVNKIYKFVF